jgi:2'-hydroxyisoflavone reductase
VYADQSVPGQRASTAATLDPLPADADETAVDAETYGRAKVASEIAYREGFGADRSLICRAGLIVGAEDPTGRFEYWLRRIAAGAAAATAEVLVPGDPTDPVQLIDVRDLADWLILAGSNGRAGTYDGISPSTTRTAFVQALAEGLSVAPTITFVPQRFLLAHKVQPWDGDRSLPVWVPVPQYAGFMSRNVDASQTAGLGCRSLAETARDTWRWLERRPPSHTPGIDRDTEINILSAWRSSPTTDWL